MFHSGSHKTTENYFHKIVRLSEINRIEGPNRFFFSPEYVVKAVEAIDLWTNVYFLDSEFGFICPHAY